MLLTFRSQLLNKNAKNIIHLLLIGHVKSSLTYTVLLSDFYG